ncbi:MAG: hypothetical protein U0K39_01385, partial [Latilactobacillus curvatus]|nr:hypothetical protein [Latilactobacillus curvatus]
ILDKVRTKGTDDYQQRIPSATQTGVANTMRYLFDPMNRQYLNDCVWSMVNRIGLTVMAQNAPFENPLAVFKKENLYWGSTVQEIAVKWIKAHGYKDDAEELLKMHRPEAAVWFYEMNRRDQYPISWTEDELRQAFVDDFGLNRFIAQIMETPRNSDNYDEMNIMLALIRHYEQTLGFYKVHLDKIPSDETTARTLLKALRSTAGRMQFPSTQYNALNVTDIPAYANPQQMVLLIEPEYLASIDVDALSAVFQLDKAEVPYRIVQVPSLGIEGAVALLVATDWYQVRDIMYGTTQFYNPQTLGNTLYLNHWGIYGVSPFTPCALFTTDAGTSINVVTQTVTGFTLTPTTSDVKAGDVVQLTPKLTATVQPTGTAIEVAPNSATYEMSAKHGAEGAAFQLDVNTFVDDQARLHVQRNGLKARDVITVTGTATYVNPTGETTEHKAECTFTVK